ncbi:hypothetical protein BsWGS_03630 [Bradybaena similaris]
MAAQKAAVREEFDDSEDEALTEIETLAYSIEEPEEPTFMDSVMETLLGDITPSSALKQLVIGGIVGWGTGYVALSIGHMAAVGVGGTFLLIQVAQYNGYIKMDWTKVQHALTKSEAKVRCYVMRKRQSVFAKAYRFYEENVFLASGFIAGFCLYFFM